MQVQVYMFVSVCQACTFIMDISIIIKFEEACIEPNWLCIEKMNKPESQKQKLWLNLHL